MTLVDTNVDPLNLIAKLYRGFADPSRLSIVTVLCKESRNVGEIVELTGLTQPNVSNHLRCLSDCGLVLNERSGRHIRYMISDPRVARLLHLAEELLADVATGVETCTSYTELQEA